MDPSIARYESWLRRVFLVLAGGIALAAGLFLATSIAPSQAAFGNPCGDLVAGEAFDPWTGQPHGRIFDVYDCPTTTPITRANVHRLYEPIPEAMLGRQAIPVPIGFAIGCVATLVALTVMDRRQRRSPGLTGQPSPSR